MTDHAPTEGRDVERRNRYAAYLNGFRDGVTGRAYRVETTHRLWSVYSKGLDDGRRALGVAAREASIEGGGYVPSPFRSEP